MVQNIWCMLLKNLNWLPVLEGNYRFLLFCWMDVLYSLDLMILRWSTRSKMIVRAQMYYSISPIIRKFYKYQCLKGMQILIPFFFFFLRYRYSHTHSTHPNQVPSISTTARDWSLVLFVEGRCSGLIYMWIGQINSNTSLNLRMF